MIYPDFSSLADLQKLYHVVVSDDFFDVLILNNELRQVDGGKIRLLASASEKISSPTVMSGISNVPWIPKNRQPILLAPLNARESTHVCQLIRPVYNTYQLSVVAMVETIKCMIQVQSGSLDIFASEARERVKPLKSANETLEG